MAQIETLSKEDLIARIPLRLAMLTSLGVLAGVLGTATLVNLATFDDWATVDGATAWSLAWRLESAKREQLLVTDRNAADDRGGRRYALAEPAVAPVSLPATIPDSQRPRRGSRRPSTLAATPVVDRQLSGATAPLAASSGHANSLDAAAALGQEAAPTAVGSVGLRWSDVGTQAPPVLANFVRPTPSRAVIPRRLIRMKAGRAFHDARRLEDSRQQRNC